MVVYVAYYVISVYVAKISKTRCYNACVDRIKRLTEKNLFPCCCYQQEANMADSMEKGEINVLSPHTDYPDRVNHPRDYEPLLNRSGQN